MNNMSNDIYTYNIKEFMSDMKISDYNSDLESLLEAESDLQIDTIVESAIEELLNELIDNMVNNGIDIVFNKYYKNKNKYTYESKIISVKTHLSPLAKTNDSICLYISKRYIICKCKNREVKYADERCPICHTDIDEHRKYALLYSSFNL